MRARAPLFWSLLLASHPAFGAFGLEMGPLLKLVAGQVVEIEKLTQQIGIAKDNQAMLLELNAGIEKTVTQIEAVEAVVERAQGLDPSAVRSVAELNQYMRRTKDAKRSVEELMAMHTAAADIAVQQSALQSETAYLMGQEMAATGAALSIESKNASPGRASQIAAASASASVMSQGVQLQTLSQIAQLQAMQLNLMRAQIDLQQQERKAESVAFRQFLSGRTEKGVPNAKR